MRNLITNKLDIHDKIFTIRDLQVMLDRDLAELYGVETKALNQAVKRNNERFPKEFRFQLSETEKNKLVTNCDRLQLLKHSSFRPFVFTEQGVSMLSAILKSDTAIKISIQIIEAFVSMRKFISSNALIFQKFDVIEQKLLKHDDNFNKIFEAIENQDIKPKQGIFYDGQIFDAYAFVSELIKSAKDNIVLIDNYIDENVLILLSKNQNVKIAIYTKSITDQLKLDIQKYNSQYNPIEAKEFNLSHDRFLIIDESIYHIGASIKDLGKKWFAFSKMDRSSLEIMAKL